MIDLLERESESRVLAAALDQARAAVGAAVLVIGEAGIGKTALLRHAVADATDCRVLTARGTRLERDYGYGVVRQLFDPVLHDVVLRERLLADPVLTRALPALGLATTARDTDEAGDRDAEFATRHGLYWLLATLAQDRPVVVVVDDAHWADAESLRWLLHTLSRLAGLRAAVLMGWRAPELATPEDLLDEIRGVPGLLQVEPRPLSLGAAAALGGELDATAAHEQSAGNPFYLIELLREGSEPGGGPLADTIRRHVLQRLRPLPDDCVALARAIAVLDSDSPIALAATVADLDPAAALRAADQLVEAGLIDRGDRLRFAHPVLRSAVYDGQPRDELDAAHVRAAHALADRALDRAATQLLAVLPRGNQWVVTTLVEAARRSIAAAAPGPARVLLERALEEPPASQYEVIAILGRAQSLYGDPAAGETYRRAADLASTPGQRIAALRGLAGHLGAVNRLPEAVDVLAAAIEELGTTDPQLSEELEADLAHVGLEANSRAAEVVRRVTAQVTSSSDDTPAGRRLLIAAALTRMSHGTGTAQVALALVRRGLPDPSYVVEHPVDSSDPGSALAVLSWVDRPDLGIVLADAFEAEARRTGSLLHLVTALSWKADFLRDLGELAEGEALAREALALGPDVRYPAAALLPYLPLLAILVTRGDLDGAQAALEAAGRAGLEPTPTMTGLGFLVARLVVRLALRCHDNVAADLAWADAELEVRGGRSPGVAATAAAVAVVAPQLAPAAAAEVVAQARSWGAPRRLASCLVTQAALDPVEVEPRLREALALLDGSGFRVDLAAALLALGGHLRRAGRRSEARPLLDRALDLATACGAVPIAEEARTELLACGARPRRDRLTGEQSLTPSELRVARLAAAGRSNPEIAQQLFVTRSTVETHLSAAYRKLDVTSRAGLRQVLEVVSG